ncbi:MAG: hypothetical protein KZQ83_06745 [gamma proteobacterium symbiont of Taylorina sp.]|nr:hypothetical protein [gamma proteobacterium symbiont of Taylorina sp.]
MGTTVGEIMAFVGFVFLGIGTWLIKKFDNKAGYCGIGNPYPYSGIFTTLGLLAAILGGFLVVFGIGMIII